jgi:hypothetical protein
MRQAIRKVISLNFGSITGTYLPNAELSNEPDAEFKGVALLVTRDKLSLQWAPRWLQHVGLDVKSAETTDEAPERVDRRCGARNR